MRRDLLITAAFGIYSIAALYLLISNTLRGFRDTSILLVPFVVDQLYLLTTRTRYRRIYALNALVLSVAIALLFYLSAKYS